MTGDVQDLKMIGSAELSAPYYSFDLIGAWVDKSGGIYLSTDSGCSCPMPWENHGTIDDLTGPLTKAQAIEEAYSLWRSDDDEGDEGYDPPAFREFIAEIEAA